MKVPEKTEVMQEIAALFRSKIKSANLCDANARGKFTESTAFPLGGFPYEIDSNGSILRIQIKIELPLGGWSINQSDKIMLRRIKEGGPTTVGRLPLFISGAVFDEAVALWRSASFLGWLEALDLGPEESLHVYRNAVCLYVNAHDGFGVQSRIDLLLDFARSNSITQEPGVRILLPETFGDLEDLAQVWAISDDDVRADLIENASRSRLRLLVQKVTPRMEAINEYLDIHDDERAAALAALAEAASEAMITLDRLRQ